MPELPEIETTRLGIGPEIVKQIIDRVIIRHFGLRWPVAADLADLLTGQKIISVGRRSKYLLLSLTSGTLIIHLGMSGSLRIVTADTALIPHDHIDLVLTNGRCLRFNDPRRFGSVIYTRYPPENHALLSHLGPEPLSSDFCPEFLSTKLAGRKIPVKNAIMNAQIVVGVGNIYANEALFRAAIHPLRPAGNLTDTEIIRLIQHIKTVLQNAIARGGTTLKDFLNPNGKPGYFKQELKVYGRGNLPCLECGTQLEELRLQNRTTVLCPVCQPLNL